MNWLLKKKCRTKKKKWNERKRKIMIKYGVQDWDSAGKMAN